MTTQSIYIKIDKNHINHFMRNFGTNLSREIGQAGFNYCKHGEDKFKINLLNVQGRHPSSSRRKAADRIKARKLNVTDSQTVAPRSLYKLDTEPEGFHDLKSGLKITKWARKHFGQYSVSHKSKVYYSDRGVIQFNKKKKSRLYTKPIKFIEKSLRQIKPMLREEIINAVKRATKKSKR